MHSQDLLSLLAHCWRPSWTCWRAPVWLTCPVDLTGTFLSLQTSSSRCKVRFRGLKPSPLHTYPALPAGTAPAGVAGVAAVLPARGPCSA